VTRRAGHTDQTRPTSVQSLLAIHVALGFNRGRLIPTVDTTERTDSRPDIAARVRSRPRACSHQLTGRATASRPYARASESGHFQRAHRAASGRLDISGAGRSDLPPRPILTGPSCQHQHRLRQHTPPLTGCGPCVSSRKVTQRSVSEVEAAL
jgi:hypothetical protein